MTTDQLRAQVAAQVAALPTKPGVYTFRDAAGRVIYVGKAANLRSRVRSYFGSPRALEGKDPPARRQDRPARHRHDPHRAGRPPPRSHAGQAPPAVLQRPPQGRQALPLPQGRCRLALAARHHHPPRPERRRSLFRPLRLGKVDPHLARPRQETLPLALLRQRDHRLRPASLPRVLHPPLHRPLHLLLHARRVPRSDRPDHALPRRQELRRRRAAQRRDGRGRRRAQLRARRDPPRPALRRPTRHRAATHRRLNRIRNRRLRDRR